MNHEKLGEVANRSEVEDGSVSMDDVESIGRGNNGSSLEAEVMVYTVTDLYAEMLRETHGCEPYSFF